MRGQEKKRKKAAEDKNNRGGGQFDPEVRIHYVHTVFLCSYMDSISGPPCNNLCMPCIIAATLSGDWKKLDDTVCGKYMLTNYLQGSSPPRQDLQGTRPEFYWDD